MNNAARKSYRDSASTTAATVLGAAVAISVAGCSGAAGTHSATAPSAAPAVPGHQHGVTDRTPQGIIGQISTENGSTWTVTVPDGTPYSVSITPDTHFGTPQAPRTAQQFPVGTTVHVTGPVTGRAITAILITPSRRS